jgi:adenylate kinase
MEIEELRQRPNIVITGTPGTGKSTHAQVLIDACPVRLQHINVVELVKQKELHDGYDQEWQSYIVDEDKACTTTSFKNLGTINNVVNWGKTSR